MAVKDPTTRIFWIVAGAVALIGLGSFTLSFMALYELATANGVPPRLGWIWPLIVDVSMVIYTAAILVSQLQQRGARLPVALTVFFALVTITGNILHAPRTVLGWFVAALPPLSLIFGSEMLRAMAHHNIQHRTAVVTLNELQQAQTVAQNELDGLHNEIGNLHKNIQTERSTFEAQRAQFERQAAILRGELEQLRREKQAALDDTVTASDVPLPLRQAIQLDAILAAGLSKRQAAELVNISRNTVNSRLELVNGTGLRDGQHTASEVSQ